MSGPVGKHPNAIVAGTSGGGGGVLVVWLLGLAGVEMTPEIGALIAGALGSAALIVGRKGVRGLARAIWRGSGG
jgi:hypothetical protein